MPRRKPGLAPRQPRVGHRGPDAVLALPGQPVRKRVRRRALAVAVGGQIVSVVFASPAGVARRVQTQTLRILQRNLRVVPLRLRVWQVYLVRTLCRGDDRDRGKP